MKLKIIAVGKLKSRSMDELVKDYAKRLTHYLPFELTIVKDDGHVKIDNGDFFVVCDERGDEASSTGLADFILRHQRSGTKRLVFFVGDAKGVDPALKKSARTTLSLSKMTFPHELARVVLIEQLYRACTILRGEKYHYV